MNDRIRAEQVRLIEATVSPFNLYRGCEHVLNDTTCDAMCDAYVRGDGMIAVEPTDLWDDKTIADAESLLEDSDEDRDLVADILAVAARQFRIGEPT